MPPLIWGVKQTPTGYDEFFIRCPHCEKNCWAELVIYSKWYHFYGTPIFPFEKDADISCKSCELKRYGVPFDADLITNFDEVKSKYRHPWFTYLGVIIAALIVSSILLARIF